MASLRIEEFKKLRSFFQRFEEFKKPTTRFLELKDGTTLSRADCLDILRSNFSSLSGEEFKDDNKLINFLSNKRNLSEILSKLPKQQWEELSQQLAAAEPQGSSGQGVNQPTGQTEQPIPAGEPAGSMIGGMHGLPSSGSVSISPRVRIVQAPPTPTPVTDKAERMTAGKGTAVTNKAERLAYADQKSPVIDKAERLRQSSAAKTEPTAPPAGQPSIKTTSFSKTSPTPTSSKPNIASSRRINFPAFRPSASTINIAKNFGSGAGTLFNTASRGVARGLGEMAKGLGRGVLNPAASGIYNVGGRVLNRGINTLGNLSRIGGGGGGVSGKGLLVKILKESFFFFF